MISEYERQREENIRRNQEILASLNIPKLETKIKKTNVTTPSVVGKKLKKAHPEPTRKSSRILEKATGVNILPKENYPPPTFKEEIKPKPPRIVSKIPFEPSIGATDEFTAMMENLSNPTGSKEKPEFDLEFKHRYCIVKCAQDRVYSMGFMQDCQKIIPIAGTKFGHLVFWDATDIIQDDYSPPEDMDLDKIFIPKVFSFCPHPDESISNIRVVENSIYTSSYDSTIKKMDMAKGCFIPMFVPQDKGRKGNDLDEWIICGMDFKNKNEFIISDIHGRVGELDFRVKDPLVKTHNLAEKKIGCVSAAHNFIASSCNDGSISVWDSRKVGQSPLHKFQYDRAVTGVYFHPNDPDYLVSTCYDDHIRIHRLSNEKTIDIRHNNQTGRWITPFRAVWDPKSPANSPEESMIVCGNMNRGLDIFDGNGRLFRNLTSEFVTSQPAVAVCHESLPIVACGNASGKIVLYKK
jgi:WD repeat-containing protein 76